MVFSHSRLLHTMLRVTDMQRSIKFYTDVLGMNILRKFDRSTEKYELVFLGYGEEAKTCVLELTYNYGVSKYDLGTGFGHLAIAVDDCHQAAKTIIERGGEISRPPGPLKGSTEVIAFVKDPDGYSIELIERP